MLTICKKFFRYIKLLTFRISELYDLCELPYDLYVTIWSSDVRYPASQGKISCITCDTLANVFGNDALVPLWAGKTFTVVIICIVTH